MRKVSEYHNDTVTKRAVVYRDAEFNEYVVRLFIRKSGSLGWIHSLDADYHTDDRADAIATAIYEVSKP